VTVAAILAVTTQAFAPYVRHCRLSFTRCGLSQPRRLLRRTAAMHKAA
jgi:hypothetical protein